MLVDQGDRLLLNLIRAEWNANGVDLFLYSNDVTPDRNTTEADLTAATFNGSTPITLTAWTAAATLANGKTQISEVLQIFEKADAVGGENIYGWGIRETLTGKLISAKRLSGAPVLMDAMGDRIGILPTFGLDNDPAA